MGKQTQNKNMRPFLTTVDYAAVTLKKLHIQILSPILQTVDYSEISDKKLKNQILNLKTQEHNLFGENKPYLKIKNRGYLGVRAQLRKEIPNYTLQMFNEFELDVDESILDDIELNLEKSILNDMELNLDKSILDDIELNLEKSILDESELDESELNVNKSILDDIELDVDESELDESELNLEKRILDDIELDEFELDVEKSELDATQKNNWETFLDLKQENISERLSRLLHINKTDFICSNIAKLNFKQKTKKKYAIIDKISNKIPYIETEIAQKDKLLALKQKNYAQSVLKSINKGLKKNKEILYDNE